MIGWSLVALNFVILLFVLPPLYRIANALSEIALAYENWQKEEAE